MYKVAVLHNGKLIFYNTTYELNKDSGKIENIFKELQKNLHA